MRYDSSIRTMPSAESVIRDCRRRGADVRRYADQLADLYSLPEADLIAELDRQEAAS